MFLCKHICVWSLSKVLSECAVEQRVRRACTAGKKKQALGGQAAVTLYKDIDNREALTEMLIAANFQKDSRIKSFPNVTLSQLPSFLRVGKPRLFPVPSDEVCRAGQKQGE